MAARPDDIEESEAEILAFADGLTSISKAIRRHVSEGAIPQHIDTSVWLHDGGAFGQSYVDYAAYLSTLVLLYERIYWYRPCSELLVPRAFEASPAFSSRLVPLGITTRFPDLLAELIANGIVIPIGSHLDFCLPLESSQEAVALNHYIEVPGVDFSALPETARFRHVISGLLKEAPITSQDARPNVSAADDILEALVYHRAFETPTVFAPNEHSRRVWDMVCTLRGRPDSAKPIAETAGPIDICGKFLERVIFKSPQVMAFDELMHLREDQAAREMRKWLTTAYASALAQIRCSDPMDAVIYEFNRLAESHGLQRGRTVLDFTLSATVGALGALVGNIPGAIVGAGGTWLLEPWIKEKLVRWLTPYRWVLSFVDLRERYRVGRG